MALDNIRSHALQYYVGCSGWSYSSWQGPFYPPTTDNSAWLKYYSHVFDYVEIDSSFYRSPSPFMYTIALKTIENNATRIDVEWDIKVSGLFGIFSGMIKKHILKGTEEALQRISETVS